MNPQPKLTIELYGQPFEITKQAVSEALEQITPEEREGLMRKVMAPDKPELDLSQVTDLEFDGIDHSDYPDFCDAYVCEATYQGRDMTEDELDDLNENYSGFVHEKLFDHLY